MKRPYDYLLFDLDGTLTDPMEGITRSVQYALRHFGIEVEDLCTLTPFIGPPLAESFRTFYGFSEERIPEAIRTMREYFGERGWRENRVYDGMPQLLGTLQRAGYTLAVATSKPTLFAQRILDHFDLARWFVFVGGAEMDGHRQAKADGNYYLLLHVKEPIVIVECGFLSNAKEARRLEEDKYQDRLAWSLHIGIMEYLNGESSGV